MSQDPSSKSTPDADVEEKTMKKRSKGSGRISTLFQILSKRIPLFSKAYDKFQEFPPRLRVLLGVVLVSWKCLTTYIFILLLLGGVRKAHLSKKPTPTPHFRILHIVTTLAEYNTGTRSTTKGEDRLQNTLIPVLKSSVESLLEEEGWHVDVFLVLGFELAAERRELIAAALPKRVGLQVWSDATPLGYDRGDGKKIQSITRALARQHRYVIKDKLPFYDFFTVFEDDMLISREHVRNFMSLEEDIQSMAEGAPASSSDTSLSAPLTKAQLRTLVPGFFRVEVLPSPPSPKSTPIPTLPTLFNTTPCCNHPDRPIPDPSQLITWETNIKAFGLRKLPPPVGWVGLQPGPKGVKKWEQIKNHWTGDDGAFGKAERPSPGDPQHFGQQGGFMLSKSQIEKFQQRCRFLPPFDPPDYRDDGLFRMNVEFWSGGYQHFGGGKGGCNFQRFISLDADKFGKHLLYHTADNKQKYIAKRRLVSVKELFGMLRWVIAHDLYDVDAETE